MKLYSVASSQDRHGWTTSTIRANILFEEEADYIEEQGIIDEDDYVQLLEIELQDFCDGYEKNWDLDDQLEDKAKVIKEATWVPDPEEGDPREDGYDCDYYVRRHTTEG